MKHLRDITSKDHLVNQIIDIEWEMFDKVQNIGGRASCQDDEQTFYIMRYSQHSSFSTEMLDSYMKDLRRAESEGRNVITEKYAYMMKFTEPAYYETQLRAHLPVISEEKRLLINKIVDHMEDCEKCFAKQYPVFASKGRPTDQQGGVATSRIYSIGELKTYSEMTLELYWRDIQEAEKQGRNIVYDIHGTTASFYGYSSFEEAERKLATS